MAGCVHAYIPDRRAIAGWIVVGCLALLSCTASAQQVKSATQPDGAWEILDGCRLVTNSVVDGDSFHVSHKGREYIFRLYFVDTPEVDASLTERAVDQAAYFGIGTKDIPRGGRKAADFARQKLMGREFTVVTRWRNAMGRSTLARFYGVVLARGENLAEELVANGWGRIYGLKANWPDGPRSTTFINKLKNLELGAREKRLGMWNTNEFRHATFTVMTAATKERPRKGSVRGVDLNEASFEELQSLPGIGPKMAERIMANRPYQKIEDLVKVNGIGESKMVRLKPLVRAGQVEAAK